MKQHCIVFLGPSLPRERAQKILDAEYRPPAMRGDILRAAGDGALVIGLIDGVFFQESAVSHKEILEVLMRGVRVVGASSMGALRAAELDTLGMEGVGEVYRLYRTGILVSDDEVALVFDPSSYAPLSEPLINIRCTIRRAVAEGVVTHDDGEVLLAAARSLYFPDRTYGEICDASAGKVRQEVLSGFLAFARTRAHDLKAEDAIIALETIRAILFEAGSQDLHSSHRPH
ncbi:MAG: TfuA-related McrA-glycine thioamidation protein [Methanoregulaceae archaeon]|nr:TfuA-related McrA-glycine thioamidation protein [Methanoregulaceae archaeon]